MSASFLTPVGRTTLTADVSRQLVTHIVRGDWGEGDRIPSERELCRLLGVGRASLREALKALEIMGMIETRVGQGTFACHRSEFLSRPLLWSITGSDPSQVTDVTELIEARRLVESELAGIAAGRASEEEVRKIGQHLTSMEQAHDRPELFLEADLDFHLAIAVAAHNRLLLNAVQLIRNLMRQWVGQTLQVAGTSTEAVRQHHEILLNIVGKDEAGARSAMHQHLDSMGKLLLRVRAQQISK
jgi:GntR family transcriptional repressor for pyruvate dehydrogenase complex